MADAFLAGSVAGEDSVVYDADATRGLTARRRRSGRRRERREAGGTMWGKWLSPSPRVVLEGRSVSTPRRRCGQGFVAAQ